MLKRNGDKLSLLAENKNKNSHDNNENNDNSTTFSNTEIYIFALKSDLSLKFIFHANPRFRH